MNNELEQVRQALRTFSNQRLTIQELDKQLFEPLAVFIKENHLGELTDGKRTFKFEKDVVDYWFFCGEPELITHPDYENLIQLDMQLFRDGSAVVDEGIPDAKTLFKGTWLKTAKWLVDFFVREGEKARDYYYKKATDIGLAAQALKKVGTAP